MRKTVLPCRELIEVLLPAYQPCRHFRGSCQMMRWRPASGHVPRGFCGGVGRLNEIELVLVVAEPGDPHEYETYDESVPAFEKLAHIFNVVFQCFETERDQFHKNVGYILKSCWPDLSFAQRMRRVWITESVLCSAAKEGGHVPLVVHRQCHEDYLSRQIELLKGRTIVALGRKAQARLGNVKGVVGAASVAPPGCNFRGAKESWDEIPEILRSRRSRK